MATLKDQKQSKKFIFVFLSAILIIRFLLYLIPRSSVIYSDKFHHIFVGIFLLLIYFLFKNFKFSKYLLAVILGLILDQISAAPFYIAELLNKPLVAKEFWNYWSPYSLISTIVVIIISLVLIRKFGD